MEDELLETGTEAEHLREKLVELLVGKEYIRTPEIAQAFTTLREARVLMEGWRREYNKDRPHSALSYRPPAPETILPLPPGSAPLHPAVTAYGLT